jgi:hypothetical protein
MTSAVRGYDDTESCAFSMQQRPKKTKKPVALEVPAMVRSRADTPA